MLLDNLDSKLENPVYESEMEYLDDLEIEEEIAFEESLELDEADIDAILNGDDDIPDEYEGYDANESFMALESDFDFGLEGCESDEFDEDEDFGEDDDFDIDDFDEDDIDEEGIRDVAHNLAVGHESDMSFEEEFDSAIESVLGGDFLNSLDNYNTAVEGYDLEESLEALTAALEELDEDEFEMDEEGCATEEEDDFGFDDFDEDDDDKFESCR